MKAIGLENLDSLNAFMSLIAEACFRDGVVNETQVSLMLSIIKGMKPRDQIEAMLTAQMATIHMAMLQNSRFIERYEVDSLGGFINKLARTFTAQVDALQRYRTGSEQKVTLQQNVSVTGGQTIVGNVTQSSRDQGSQKPGTPEAHTDVDSVFDVHP